MDTNDVQASTLIQSGIEVIVSPLPATLTIIVPNDVAQMGLRASLYCREIGSSISSPLPLLGPYTSIPLRGARKLSNVLLSIERRAPEGWRLAMPRMIVSRNRTTQVHRISPEDWGVTKECIASIRTKNGATVNEFTIKSAEEVDVVLDFLDASMLQLRFHESVGGRRGKVVSTPSRIVSHDYSRNSPEIAKELFAGKSMATSVRHDVTLNPTNLNRERSGPFSYLGYSGAWSGSEPIAESLEFALGRQQFLFQQRPQSPVTELPSPLIYLGAPHSSWGHFLTQGLSRIWYALDNPDIPVIWDAKALPLFAEPVLQLLGFKNEIYFLKSASHGDEVIFPEPGIVLGDYVSKDFVERIGVVPIAERVPGRKIFLSRANLSGGRGSLGQEKDQDLLNVMIAHGFEAYSPEGHSIKEQLDTLSSADVVAGVEGSAFHSLLLLENGCETRFRAFSRHRGGSGVFEHIKNAKRLDYETLNFLTGDVGGARSSISMDLHLLDQYLTETNGFSCDLDGALDVRERPHSNESRYSSLLATAQIDLTREQEATRELIDALTHGREQDSWKALARLT